MSKDTSKEMSKDKIGQLNEFFGKLNPIKKITDAILKARLTHFATLTAAFCHKHPETFMILCDPQTDLFFMSYDKYQVPIRLVGEDGKMEHIIKGAMLFNAATLDHANEMNILLGRISGGLDAIRQLREDRISKEKREYKHIAFVPPKYREAEKKAKKEAKLEEKIEKIKRTRKRIQEEQEQQQIAKEQAELDRKGRE